MTLYIGIFSVVLSYCRAALSSLGWKATRQLKELEEYLAMDFECADKPGAVSLMEIGPREMDFFVADQRGYGSIFLKMANELKKKFFSIEL